MNVADEDLSKIHEAVTLYHDAHYYADVEKLERAFHQEAQIIGHYRGESFVTKRDDYRDVISGDVSPASQGEPMDIKILAIDKTDYVNWREHRAREKFYFSEIRRIMREAKEAGLIDD